MSKKQIWSKEKYAAWIKGDRADNIPSLRSIAAGFDAKPGGVQKLSYALSEFDNWTPYQRRKVREYARAYRLINAQHKEIVRPRSDELLHRLQNSFHGEYSGKKFKVAFVPGVAQKPKAPGAKPRPPKIRYTRDAVRIDYGTYERITVPFNMTSLAANTAGELKRAAQAMPGATLFVIQNGEYQTMNGKDLGVMIDQVRRWMAKYDGKTPLTGARKHDRPEQHDYRRWLHGMVGYVSKSRLSVKQQQQLIIKGREQAREASRNIDNAMKRKNLRR